VCWHCSGIHEYAVLKGIFFVIWPTYSRVSFSTPYILKGVFFNSLHTQGYLFQLPTYSRVSFSLAYIFKGHFWDIYRLKGVFGTFLIFMGSPVYAIWFHDKVLSYAQGYYNLEHFLESSYFLVPTYSRVCFWTSTYSRVISQNLHIQGYYLSSIYILKGIFSPLPTYSRVYFEGIPTYSKVRGKSLGCTSPYDFRASASPGVITLLLTLIRWLYDALY
jgi:hypothetical protein